MREKSPLTSSAGNPADAAQATLPNLPKKKDPLANEGVRGAGSLTTGGVGEGVAKKPQTLCPRA